LLRVLLAASGFAATGGQREVAPFRVASRVSKGEDGCASSNWRTRGAIAARLVRRGPTAPDLRFALLQGISADQRAYAADSGSREFPDRGARTTPLHCSGFCDEGVVALLAAGLRITVAKATVSLRWSWSARTSLRRNYSALRCRAASGEEGWTLRSAGVLGPTWRRLARRGGSLCAS